MKTSNMILTKADLVRYLEEDERQCGYKREKGLKAFFVSILFPNPYRSFLRNLRILEYHINNHNRWCTLYYNLRHSRLKRKTGIDLQPNVAGPGIHIPHGNIVVNSDASIGSNCKILPYTVIGMHGRYDRLKDVPQIGNRVYIGAGSKIIGNVTIADDVVIGANSVVIKSILEPNTTWVGNPAKKVADTGSEAYLNREQSRTNDSVL